MNLEWFEILLAFILGSAIGSFLNVCIYRIPRQMSIIFPASSCPRCMKPIRWYDNIPYLSFFLLGRKCRGCGEPISWQYPIVEGASGILCGLLMYLYGASVPFIIYYFFCACLIVVTTIDIEFQIIPNVISVPGIVIGFLVSVVYAGFFINTGYIRWYESLLGIVVGSAFLGFVSLIYFFVTKTEGMGMGDIKLIAMIGAFLGIEGVIVTILVGSVAGSIMGIILMIRKKGNAKMKLPYGPFLSIGAVSYIVLRRLVLFSL